LSACSADQSLVLVNTHNISIERQLFTLAHDWTPNISSQPNGRGNQRGRKGTGSTPITSLVICVQKALDRALDVFNDLIQLKAHFRVSYTMMLMRLEQMGS